MYKQENAKLVVDGKEIFCTAIGGAGNGNISGEIYRFEGQDDVSLAGCKGKIVLSDKPVGAKLCQTLKENGALGFITFNGSYLHNSRDVLNKAIRGKFEDENKIPGVNIHLKDAVKILRKKRTSFAQLISQHTEYVGISHNVIVDIPGESEEYIIVSAHYDSTQFSNGAFDNMSGCIGLLHVAEYFKTHTHKLGIRLLFCGSEEIGLVGSRVYCRDHKEELSNVALNVNLDMLGCFMGRFTCFSCIDEKTEEFLKNFAKEQNYAAETRFSIRSSDQNPFLCENVMAVSFARYPVSDTGEIHSRYDTKKIICEKQLYNDIDFVAKLCDFAVNNYEFFRGLEISEKIKTEAQNSVMNYSELI